MNKSAIINTCDWGSTGKIAIGLYNYIINNGGKPIFCYGRGENKNNDERYRIDSKLEIYMHAIDNRLTGRLNSSSKLATKRLIKKLRNLQVKQIFIINLHGLYLNEDIFLDYLVHDDINVVYIMADESAFLGNCTYRNGCANYLKRCTDCKHLTRLNKFLHSDASSKAYTVKEQAYKKLNATFVAPEFVINAAKKSPLMNGCNLEIVDEAIDVNVNTPKDSSALRKQLGISMDKIVIGCVAPYTPKYTRKGVQYLIEAAKKLEDDERIIFVQVGYGIEDKSFLPKNYIPIGYVSDQSLLTQYYSLADLFVFPSLEDTMPNACLEALACGSPLLCFNTSGMPYMADETVMTLVEPKDVEQMVEVICHTTKKTQHTIDTCRKYALKRYDNQKYFEKLTTIMNKMQKQ